MVSSGRTREGSGTRARLGRCAGARRGRAVARGSRALLRGPRGLPLRVYRGVRSGTCGFCPDARGVTYWTDDLAAAKSYTGEKPDGIVYSAHLDLQNVYDMTTDAAVMRFAAWADETSPHWAPPGGTSDWAGPFELVDRLDMPEILGQRGYDGVAFEDVVDEGPHRSWAVWDVSKIRYGYPVPRGKR